MPGAVGRPRPPQSGHARSRNRSNGVRHGVSGAGTRCAPQAITSTNSSPGATSVPSRMARRSSRAPATHAGLCPHEHRGTHAHPIPQRAPRLQVRRPRHLSPTHAGGRMRPVIPLCTRRRGEGRVHAQALQWHLPGEHVAHGGQIARGRAQVGPVRAHHLAAHGERRPPSSARRRRG